MTYHGMWNHSFKKFKGRKRLKSTESDLSDLSEETGMDLQAS